MGVGKGIARPSPLFPRCEEERRRKDVGGEERLPLFARGSLFRPSPLLRPSSVRTRLRDRPAYWMGARPVGWRGRELQTRSSMVFLFLPLLASTLPFALSLSLSLDGSFKAAFEAEEEERERVLPPTDGRTRTPPPPPCYTLSLRRRGGGRSLSKAPPFSLFTCCSLQGLRPREGGREGLPTGETE